MCAPAERHPPLLGALLSPPAHSTSAERAAVTQLHQILLLHAHSAGHRAAEQPLIATVKCAAEESAHSPMRTLTLELWRALLYVCGCVCVCVCVCLQTSAFSEVSLYFTEREQTACVFLITQRHFSTKV